MIGKFEIWSPLQLQVDLTLLHCSTRQAIYGLGLAAAAAAEGGDFAAEVVFMSLAVLLVTQTDFVRPTTTGKRIERGGGGGGGGNSVIWSTGSLTGCQCPFRCLHPYFGSRHLSRCRCTTRGSSGLQSYRNGRGDRRAQRC